MKHTDKYFSSIDELEGAFRVGTFKMHLVLPSAGGVLRLKPYLKQIIVDNPNRAIDGVDMYSQAIGAMRLASRIGGLNGFPIESRGCQHCGCLSQYKQMNDDDIKRLFEV